MSGPSLPAGDSRLVQIVDLALADSARRSGEWLVCRAGCTQCCIGVFSISQLDAMRLRHGLTQMAASDPQRAAVIRQRARESVTRLSPTFPGDTATGLLDESEEAQEKFTNFANEEPCPALSPETGRCELYSFRPMTCRVFGPPMRSETEESLAVCELCYHGATTEQIVACELHPDPDCMEAALIQEVEDSSGVRGATIVAFALAQ